LLPAVPIYNSAGIFIMPFTFSHPAAVLPFCRSKKIPVSVTGLIVGSLVPDFEFLFLLRESDYLGHFWPGIILINIPAAILVSFIFHYLVRNALILHLPQFLQQRFSPLLSFNWGVYFKKHVTGFIIGVLVGVVLHVGIDAFTHRDGAVARQFAFFQVKENVTGYGLPVYFMLQLLTSLIGAFYIIWFVLRLKKEKSLHYAGRPFLYWLLVVLFTLVILAVRFTAFRQYNSSEDIIIAIVGSPLYALLAVSLIFYKQIRQQLVASQVEKLSA